MTPGQKLQQAFAETFDTTRWADLLEWDDFDEDGQCKWEAAARRFLEIIRKPNRAQYGALCATGKTWRDMTSEIVWQTYIDALIKETPDAAD